MKKNNFYVTDDHNRGFVFVGNEAQINMLRKLFNSKELYTNAIVLYDEIGVFSIPSLKREFSVFRPFYIQQWVSDNLPGLNLEFIDNDEVPYFSTCDGLELWYKENYEWYSEVLRLNELISELNGKMMFACKKDICRYEKSMATIYKKLDDMDFDCVDVIATLSTPIRRYRHVYSESDMKLALHEVYIFR